MSEQEQIKSFYDEAIFRKLHGFIYKNNRVELAWTNLEKIVNELSPASVLEIGSGIGEICHRISEKMPRSSVTGFDISAKSVEVAANLFKDKNLSFLRADNINDIQFHDKKFDLIYLMDVYEHIPLTERVALHLFIQRHISEKKGTLFLSCPTPEHLDFLRINNPGEIQPVDENIYLNDLLVLSKQTGLRMIAYQEISVWHSMDYFHAVFSADYNMQPITGHKKHGENQRIQIKKEIKKRVVTILNKKYTKRPLENNVQIRKDYIKKMLGKDLLEKAESFK